MTNDYKSIMPIISTVRYTLEGITLRKYPLTEAEEKKFADAKSALIGLFQSPGSLDSKMYDAALEAKNERYFSNAIEDVELFRRGCETYLKNYHPKHKPNKAVVLRKKDCIYGYGFGPTDALRYLDNLYKLCKAAAEYSSRQSESSSQRLAEIKRRARLLGIDRSGDDKFRQSLLKAMNKSRLTQIVEQSDDYPVQGVKETVFK